MASPGRLYTEYTYSSQYGPSRPSIYQGPMPYPIDASQRHGYMLQISGQVSSVFSSIAFCTIGISYLSFKMLPIPPELCLSPSFPLKTCDFLQMSLPSSPLTLFYVHALFFPVVFPYNYLLVVRVFALPLLLVIPTFP